MALLLMETWYTDTMVLQDNLVMLMLLRTEENVDAEIMVAWRLMYLLRELKERFLNFWLLTAMEATL